MLTNIICKRASGDIYFLTSYADIESWEESHKHSISAYENWEDRLDMCEAWNKHIYTFILFKYFRVPDEDKQRILRI